MGAFQGKSCDGSGTIGASVVASLLIHSIVVAALAIITLPAALRPPRELRVRFVDAVRRDEQRRQSAQVRSHAHLLRPQANTDTPIPAYLVRPAVTAAVRRPEEPPAVRPDQSPSLANAFARPKVERRDRPGDDEAPNRPDAPAPDGDTSQADEGAAPAPNAPDELAVTDPPEATPQAAVTVIAPQRGSMFAARDFRDPASDAAAPESPVSGAASKNNDPEFLVVTPAGRSSSFGDGESPGGASVQGLPGAMAARSSSGNQGDSSFVSPAPVSLAVQDPTERTEHHLAPSQRPSRPGHLSVKEDPAPAPISIPSFSSRGAGGPSMIGLPGYRRKGSLDYPEGARRRREEGTVRVLVTISPGGEVEHAEIDRSSGYADLDQAALRSVKSWEFDPAVRDALPVRCQAIVPLIYRLKS